MKSISNLAGPHRDLDGGRGQPALPGPPDRRDRRHRGPRAPIDVMLDIALGARRARDRVPARLSGRRRPRLVGTAGQARADDPHWIIGGSDAGAHLDLIDTFADLATVVLGKGVREHAIRQPRGGGAPADRTGLRGLFRPDRPRPDPRGLPGGRGRVRPVDVSAAGRSRRVRYDLPAAAARTIGSTPRPTASTTCWSTAWRSSVRARIPARCRARCCAAGATRAPCSGVSHTTGSGINDGDGGVGCLSLSPRPEIPQEPAMNDWNAAIIDEFRCQRRQGRREFPRGTAPHPAHDGREERAGTPGSGDVPGRGINPERLAALPLAERARFRRSTTQDWRWEPIDSVWLRLFGVLDDGVLELGKVARVTFREDPPSPS